MKHELVWPASILRQLADEAHWSMHDDAVRIDRIHASRGRVHAVTATWRGRGPSYAIVTAIIGPAGPFVIDRRPPMKSERRTCSCRITYGRRDVVITTNQACAIHGDGGQPHGA